MENRYIREYVEYYKQLGFTNICLFDNNDNDGEHFEDVIGDYIEDGFVILKDYRGRKICQLASYQECYNTYSKEYDWIAFFDCDEFLTLVSYGTIESYLCTIPEWASIVKINWMCFGDCGLLVDDGRDCLERFKTPLPYDFKTGYPFPNNNHIKCIIRGGLDDIRWISTPHAPLTKYKSCNNIGKLCANSQSPFEPYNFDNAYLKHFTTKTISEWKIKQKRGCADQSDESAKRHLNNKLFFMHNEATPEKLKIAYE